MLDSRSVLLTSRLRIPASRPFLTLASRLQTFSLGLWPPDFRLWTLDCLIGLGDLADEPIPSPVHSLDEPRAMGLIPQRLANPANADFQRCIAHINVRPGGVQ